MEMKLRGKRMNYPDTDLGFLKENAEKLIECKGQCEFVLCIKCPISPVEYSIEPKKEDQSYSCVGFGFATKGKIMDDDPIAVETATEFLNALSLYEKRRLIRRIRKEIS